MSFSLQSSAYLLISSMFVSGVDGGAAGPAKAVRTEAPSAVHYSPGLDYGSGSGTGEPSGSGWTSTPESISESEGLGDTDLVECDEMAEWAHELEGDCDDGDDMACDDLDDAYAEYGDLCGAPIDSDEGTVLDECDEIVAWIVELEEQCEAGDEVACDGLEETYDTYDADCADMPLGECTEAALVVKQHECECESKREAHAFVIKTLNENHRELKRLMDMLGESLHQLNDAERELLGASDYYVAKILGECTVAGLEAAALGKSIQVGKAACAEGVFGAQCLAAGFTVKEVTKYLATNKAVRAGVFELVKGSLEIAVEVAGEDDPRFVKVVPVLNRWCKSFDWSKKIFGAPDMIRLIGNQRIEVMKKRNELRVEMRKIERMIREANDQLREEGC